MSDTDPIVGSQFGPYRLRRLIGRGGTGAVYEVEDTRMNRVMALKVLPAELPKAPGFAQRMQRELTLASRLRDPHVLPIHSQGEIDGRLYVEMRLIDGMNLRTMLSRYGQLGPGKAVSIIRQVASALDAAHEFGLVHGDIKLDNILTTEDDFVYLGDLGIARAANVERLTEMGREAYDYEAPELFAHGETTPASDIYALGGVLYECLTGSPPYPGGDLAKVITAHLHAPVPRPSQERPGIPATFDDVIARAMAKRPEDRYARAGDLAAAAEEALREHEPTRAETTVSAAGPIEPEPTAPRDR
jgi:serine/threonine-protein kinase